MAVLSLVWGILAIIGLFVAFMPCLGSLNWLNIPFAIVGLIISSVAVSTAPQPDRGKALAGLVCCAIAVVVGFFRLAAGGGIF